MTFIGSIALETCFLGQKKKEAKQADDDKSAGNRFSCLTRRLECRVRFNRGHLNAQRVTDVSKGESALNSTVY